MAKKVAIPEKKVYQYGKSFKGHLVYCKTNKLKSFVKDKIYKIRELNGSYIRVEGIRYTCGWDHFDFIENNVALLRDMQINKLLDIDFVTTGVPEKKIDTVENKNKFIAKLLITKLYKLSGSVDNDVKVQDLSFHTLAKEVLATHKKIYQLEMEDIAFAENLTLKELIDILK